MMFYFLSSTEIIIIPVCSPPYMVHDIRGEHVTTVEVDLRSSPRGNADTTQKEQ